MRGALLVALTIVAYWPALHAGYIWDDDAYVLQNLTLRSLDGLRRIWFEVGAVPQYYPLVHTTFWIEYHLWHLAPAGFHSVNVLLHGLSAIVLWRLLDRAGLRSAWFVAAVFALHPVHVESVAWITERKNVLSGLFYLGSLTMFARYFGLLSEGREGVGSEGSPATDSPAPAEGSTPATLRLFVLGCLLYVGALLSKSVTCTLPVVLGLLLWWKHGRVHWRQVSQLGVLLLIGALSGALTVWVERTVVGAEGDEFALTVADRLLVAGRAAWFYAGKLLWPHPLVFNYPRWVLDPHSIVQLLFPLATVAVLAVLWFGRTRWGRGPLVAVLCFLVTLAPALGFFDVYPMRYSFVADHFQYLASIDSPPTWKVPGDC
ncbi:MAG: hypothetical protein R3E12_01985 [Candidatus Eisenbacteria bacterium]